MSFRTRTFAVLAATAIFATACGDDDGGDGGDTVAAGDFAADICTAFIEWQEGIQERQGDLQTGLDPEASPEEGRDALESFLSNVNDDTDTLVERVNDAGVPDADKGEEIADALKQAAEGAQTELQKAEEDVADLPVDSEAAFKEAADEFGNNIREALGNVGEGIQDIESPEVEKAFEDEEACNA